MEAAAHAGMATAAKAAPMRPSATLCRSVGNKAAGQSCKQKQAQSGGSATPSRPPSDAGSTGSA